MAHKKKCELQCDEDGTYSFQCIRAEQVWKPEFKTCKDLKEKYPFWKKQSPVVEFMPEKFEYTASKPPGIIQEAMSTTFIFSLIHPQTMYTNPKKMKVQTNPGEYTHPELVYTAPQQTEMSQDAKSTYDNFHSKPLTSEIQPRHELFKEYGIILEDDAKSTYDSFPSTLITSEIEARRELFKGSNFTLEDSANDTYKINLTDVLSTENGTEYEYGNETGHINTEQYESGVSLLMTSEEYMKNIMKMMPPEVESKSPQQTAIKMSTYNQGFNESYHSTSLRYENEPKHELLEGTEFTHEENTTYDSNEFNYTVVVIAENGNENKYGNETKDLNTTQYESGVSSLAKSDTSEKVIEGHSDKSQLAKSIGLLILNLSVIFLIIMFTYDRIMKVFF